MKGYDMPGIKLNWASFHENALILLLRNSVASQCILLLYECLDIHYTFSASYVKIFMVSLIEILFKVHLDIYSFPSANSCHYDVLFLVDILLSVQWTI